MIRNRHLPVSLRLILCCPTLFFGTTALSAQDLDLGLGMGFFHGTMHSPDPIHPEYGAETFSRDFGSPMLELLDSGKEKAFFPADDLGADGKAMTYELGYTKVQIAEYGCPMPFIRYGTIKRGKSGWGQGYLSGLGLDTGTGIRTSQGIMDEGSRILFYSNPMFVWEAGLKLHLSKEISLIGFAAKQNAASFKTPPQAGLSIQVENKY
ncbi:MAG TPA: hypothetical protein PKI59_01980 [Candidatus Cloacimonadota bacterium]|nr:hypothetical protein [Candidatus Cloacimonadota bacterium]